MGGAKNHTEYMYYTDVLYPFLLIQVAHSGYLKKKNVVHKSRKLQRFLNWKVLLLKTNTVLC